MMTAHEPVEFVNMEGSPGLLLLCDHASNAMPEGDLGLPPEEIARHIAWDPGARGVTLALSAAFDAPALLTRQSRLVIDPNRGADDPTLVMQLYDGTIIPGNRGISEADIARRRALYYDPYHGAITARLDALATRGVQPVLVSIHSMTAQLRGKPFRPWQFSVLWHDDGRIARPLIERLRAVPGLEIGDNEPYTGALDGDTMSRHGLGRGLPHVLIEVRNDLISTPEGEALWAAKLAGPLADVIAAYRAGER
ncbi:N-formylglutamate amidohydrolase [Paroceanicella profunda]|uniref:N-formylglutamate amidohydrolase n=1 Tax=Paroceanicella profunda TaxID=2579971 RepID=A0A5B8FV89_9RHOB|nr:N-formylglutamate amidohydrolase [Paroceanicella profunda]